MSKNVIGQALELVQAQITKRLQASISKMGETKRLFADLTDAGQKLVKSWDGVKEVPDEFRAGVVEVIATLESFRSGYASNGQEVSMDTQAEAALAEKSADAVTDAVMKLFDERFVLAVKSENDSEALASLRLLRELFNKALTWEAPASSPEPTVTKDPFQTTPTKEDGSVTALNSGPDLQTFDTSAAEPSASPTSAVQSQNSGPDAQTFTTKAQDAVVWPRDLAKRGFAGAGSNQSLAAAASAVEKANEPKEVEWAFDMAPRVRR